MSDFVYVDTHKLEDDDACVEVELWRHTEGKEDVLHVTPYKMNDKCVNKYVKFHQKFIEKENAKNSKLMMIYDLRHVQDPTLDYLKTFAHLHEGLQDTYKIMLQCTAIVVNNAIVTNLINFVFTTLYKPVRPVKMLTEKEKVEEFWKSSRVFSTPFDAYTNEAEASVTMN